MTANKNELVIPKAFEEELSFDVTRLRTMEALAYGLANVKAPGYREFSEMLIALNIIFRRYLHLRQVSKHTGEEYCVSGDVVVETLDLLQEFAEGEDTLADVVRRIVQTTKLGADKNSHLEASWKFPSSWEAGGSLTTRNLNSFLVKFTVAMIYQAWNFMTFGKISKYVPSERDRKKLREKLLEFTTQFATIMLGSPASIFQNDVKDPQACAEKVVDRIKRRATSPVKTSPRPAKKKSTKTRR